MQAAFTRPFAKETTMVNSEDNKRALRVLLVEDNMPDIVLTKKAFERGKYPTEMAVVRDGEQALLFLKKHTPYAGVFQPDIILLDINLPKVSGYEVLEFIKSDPLLMTTPVIMLTSSEAEQDVLKSYRLHANSYLVKPASLRKFVEIVNQLEGFWFNIVKLLK